MKTNQRSNLTKFKILTIGFTVLALTSSIATNGAHAAVLEGPVVYNGHSYYLLDQKSWAANEAEAVGLGGHLVTINDSAENDFLFSTFWGPETQLLIGFNDQAVENTFEWVSGEPVTFVKWQAGEPNDTQGGSDCAALWNPPDNSWNDVPCGESRFALVEVPSVPTPGASSVGLAILTGLMMALLAGSFLVLRRRQSTPAV